MTPEEMQRTIEFIVQQQAKFTDDIQDLFESDRQLRESQATLTAALVRITEIIEENEKRTDGRFRETDARFTKTDERFRETDKRFAALAEAQKAADERLEMFIQVVEGHLVRRRNGKKRRK